MLNKLINTLKSHLVGQKFNLDGRVVVWKKVNELKAGSFIAIENDGRLGWDEVVSIKKVGSEQVYDIEVEGTHNFVGNGILAHNTYVTGNVGIGVSNPTARLSIGGGASNIANDTGDITIIPDENLIISQGNVGVGTSTPGAKLNVVGDLRLEKDSPSSYTDIFTENYGTGGWLRFQTSGTGASSINGTTAAYEFRDSANPLLTIGASSATSIFHYGLQVNGNLTIGDASGDSVTANASSWTFANNTNFVLSGGVNGLSFDTNTLSIDATNDRVGIGTTAPEYKLDVNGNARISTLGSGATDTVVTHNSGVLETRTVDPRIWGSDLIDGSGVANYVALWSDTNTLTTGLLYDNGTKVGIGTTNPEAELDVVGNLVIGNQNRGSSYFAGTTGTFKIDNEHEISDAILANIQSHTDLTLTTNTGNRYTAAQFTSHVTGAADTSNTIEGVYAQMDWGGTGTVSRLRGVVGIAKSLPSSGNITDMAGGTFMNWTQGGTITNARAILVNNQHTGGTITNKTGIAVEEMTGATNNTNLLIGTATIPSGTWSIYNSSTRANYFAGNVGIGTTNATSALTVSGNSTFIGDLTAQRFIDYDNTSYLLDPANSGTSLTVAGNVGIGTTNPTVGLHVRKQDSTFGGDDFGASSAINIAVGAGLHEPILRFKTDSTSRWELFAYGTTSANAGKFGIADGGNHSSPALVIDTDKRVGIGTTSPGTILDVEGHITSRGSSSGLSVYKPSDSSTRVSLDWSGDMARIELARSGFGAISGLGVYDTFSGTNFLRVSGSGILVGTPNPWADPFVANLPAASIALPANGLIQGGLTATNFSAFQTTAQAGSPAGYGAWMTHNAYFDGTNWRQPRGTGTSSFLYTTNYHLGWSWRYAGSNGTDNAVITPGEVASLSSSGVLRLPLSGAVLHAGTASTTYQIPHGGGSTFLPQIQNNQSSGVAGISVGVSNSTNRRAGLFMDDTNTAWGLSFTFGSGGGVPFVINMAGNERMRVTYTGNVGIGTTNPGVPLHVAGNARVTFAAAAANTVCRDGNGTFSVCSSLSQYKDNQKNLSLGLDTIMQLRPVEFDWNINDKSHDLGLIAEEVAAVNPILAQYESDGTLSGVKYHHMTALLIKGIQQQQTQIATLSSQLATLNPNNFATLQLDSFIIDSTGNLAIEQTEQGEYQVRNTADNSLAAVMGRMAELVVGKIRAGSIAVRELSTDAITIAGLPLRDYIASTVMQMGGTQNATGSAELLSPVAKLDNLEVTGASLLAELLVTEDATFSGTLTAETTRLGELTANSATIEGTLIADNIATENIEADTIFAATISAYSSRLALLEARTAEFENMKAQTAELMEATVSGTLYANNIYNFDDKIASAFNEPTMTDILKNKVFDSINTTQNSLALVYDSVQLAGYEATSSAGLNLTLADIQTEGDDLNLGAATVFVDQYFKVNGIAYVADSLGVGNKLLIGQGMAIADGMINYTAPFGSEQLFQIQPSGRGTLSLMAGLMSLTENGNVIIDGNLAVTGNLAVQDTLLTNLMQPADFGNPFQVQVAGVSDDGTTVRDSRFEIVNEIGTPVATISAQGRAEFASGIGVGAENLGENENNEATAGKTSGKATILAGQSQLTIRSEKITANSLVYVTPVGSTQNQVLYVKSQTAENPDTSEKEGKFVVGFDSPVTEAVQFNWWIIN